MDKYKVVKDIKYTYVYNVYKEVSTGSEYKGTINLLSQKDEDIIAKAKELVAPKTIYFDA